MIIFYTGIILVLYCLLSKKKYNPTIAFLFVLLIMGFQSNVVGDYYAYKASFKSLDIRTAVDEPLWALLITLFRRTSFPVFIFCVSLFQYGVLVYCAKVFASKTWYDRLTPVLFFSTFLLMLMQMKALRQGLAVDLCLLSTALIYERKKWYWAAAPLCAAYFIHNSAMVFFPFAAGYYFWLKYLDKKPQKIHPPKKYLKQAIIAVVVFLLITFYKTLSYEFLQHSFMGLVDNRLVGYLDNIEEFELSWLWVLYDSIIVFFSVLSMGIMNRRLRPLVLLLYIGAVLEILFTGVGSLFRLSMFFVVYNIYVLPYTAKFIRQKYGDLGVCAFIILLIGYAVKSALPWVLTTEYDRFGFYNFVFLS